MARRRGRLGDHLATDELTGFTVLASKLRRSWDGYYAIKPLERNLQEITCPLNDPGSVSPYSPAQYETLDNCEAELAPLYVGVTNVLTNTQNAAAQALGYERGVGNMEIGCNFEVF